MEKKERNMLFLCGTPNPETTENYIRLLTVCATLTALTAGTVYTFGTGGGTAKAGTPGTNFRRERERVQM